MKSLEEKGLVHTTTVQNMLRAEVILGSPSKHCIGSGVCMILNIGQAKSVSCSRIPVLIGLTKMGRWELWIEKKSVSHELVQKHLAFKKFRMEESYKMPEFVCSSLAFDQIVDMEWLMQGEYPVIDSGDFYLIVF